MFNIFNNPLYKAKADLKKKIRQLSKILPVEEAIEVNNIEYKFTTDYDEFYEFKYRTIPKEGLKAPWYHNVIDNNTMVIITLENWPTIMKEANIISEKRSVI